MRRAVLLSALLLPFSPPGPLQAGEEPESLLILPFDNASAKHAAGGSDGVDTLGEAFPDLLTAFLSPYEDEVKIVDREVLEEIFAESSLSWQQYLKKNSFSELGQLLQARYILRGTISVEKKELHVNALLYETESTRVVETFEVSGDPEALTALSNELASRLGAFFEAEVEEFPSLPADADPEKSRHLIYGLGYYHNGRFPKAMTFFLKILQTHPGDEDAKFWLGKSFLAAGMESHAEIEFKEFLELHPASSKAAEVEEFLTPREKEAHSHEK